MARPMLATMVGAMKLSSRIRQVARMQSDVILGDDRSKEAESLSSVVSDRAALQFEIP